MRRTQVFLNWNMLELNLRIAVEGGDAQTCLPIKEHTTVSRPRTRGWCNVKPQAVGKRICVQRLRN